ncbi:uncharacterized protein LOC120339895 [Styela clava]
MADQDQPQEGANVVNIQAPHLPAVPQAQVQADEPSPGTAREEIPSTSGETARAQRMKGSTDAKLALKDFPCPVYEVVPSPSGKCRRKGYGKTTKGKKIVYSKKFINYFNERTWEQTKVNITENYKLQNLSEPDFEVNPQLRKVSRFYLGEMAPKVAEYNIKSEFTVKANEQKVGKPISLDELVKQLTNKRYTRIALIGQPGCGKTTILKRLAQILLVVNELVQQAQVSHGSFSLSKKIKKMKRCFKFIHHLNIKDIPILKGTSRDEAISPCELLFGKIASRLSSQDKEEGYEWLHENQSKTILFLDGLDQATWSLLGKHNKMKYTDKSSTATSMYNLLTGNLFPRMTIVISSREHRLASLPSELRPQFITALAGLARDDIKRLFIAIMGDGGEKAWEKLTMQSPALIPLSSVPLFLIFNAIGCKNNPDTMTGIMLQILHIFMRSDHTHEKNQIENKLRKLMLMSFEGTKDRRVIFTIHDLEKVELDPNDVHDFIIKVPGKNMFNQHLMEGDHLMFFSHQILQEVLSALYISNMDSTAFRAFIETEMDYDHWAVVRHFLSGIILNPDIESSLIANLSSGARQDEKIRFVREFLTSKSSQKMKSCHRLDLFGTLYEANDTELIHSCIKEINFKFESITTVGMHAMSSVMRRCNQLDIVCLCGCSLNDELVHILTSNLKGSCLKLNELDVSFNDTLGAAGFGELGIVVSQCHVEVFSAADCYLTTEGMKAFKENTRNAKIKLLDLSMNDISRLKDEGLSTISEIVYQCQVEKLGMRRCYPNLDQLERFKASIADIGVYLYD